MPKVHTCRVCHRPLEDHEWRDHRGHTFCAEHRQLLARENPAAAPPVIVEIGAVVIFAALASLAGRALGPSLNGAALALVGVVVAIVPALIWLAVFYQQDQREEQPKRLVFGVFILGALLAVAVGQPIIRGLFAVQDWLGADPVTAILGSILVIGFVQEFLKYAAVRYTVFYEPEFDERVDGIIYGAAAGLGYATALNVQYVVERGGVALAVGAITISVVALAHASFSGIMGYFIGREKFERLGPLWLPAGLIVASALDGIVTYVLSQVPLLGQSFSYNPWYGLIVATIIAALVFAGIFAIIRRLNAAALDVIQSS